MGKRSMNRDRRPTGGGEIGLQGTKPRRPCTDKDDDDDDDDDNPEAAASPEQLPPSSASSNSICSTISTSSASSASRRTAQHQPSAVASFVLLSGAGERGGGERGERGERGETRTSRSYPEVDGSYRSGNDRKQRHCNLPKEGSGSALSPSPSSEDNINDNERRRRPSRPAPQRPDNGGADDDGTSAYFSAASILALVTYRSRRFLQRWRATPTTAHTVQVMQQPSHQHARVVGGKRGGPSTIVRNNLITGQQNPQPYSLITSKRSKSYLLGGIAMCCFILSMNSMWRLTSTVPSSSDYGQPGYNGPQGRRGGGGSGMAGLTSLLGQTPRELTAPSSIANSNSSKTGGWLPTLKPVSKGKRGRVLYCGWARHKKLFPDYDKPIPWYEHYIPNLTSSDILLYSRNQHKRKDPACDGFKSANPQDLLDVFPGKILYVNGESYTVALDPLRAIHTGTDRIFQIGAFPLNSRRARDGADDPSRQVMTTTNLREADVADHTMAVTYMALYHMHRLATRGEFFQPALVDPTKRPVNDAPNGMDSVAYFTTKCIGFRQEAAVNISTLLTVHYGDGCAVTGGGGFGGGDGPAVASSSSSSAVAAAAATRPGSSSVDNSRSAPTPTVDAASGAHQQQRRGGTVHVVNQTRLEFKDNYVLYRNYAYCLVMENKEHPGYVTEKIFNAYMGGCLPIYYGTKEIFDIFHPDSFVFYDVEDPQPALDLLARLRDDRDEYYRRLIGTPMLRDGRNTVEEYFSILPTIGEGTLNCRMRAMMGLHPLAKDRRKPCALGGLWVPPVGIASTEANKGTKRHRVSASPPRMRKKGGGGGRQPVPGNATAGNGNSNSGAPPTVNWTAVKEAMESIRDGEARTTTGVNWTAVSELMESIRDGEGRKKGWKNLSVIAAPHNDQRRMGGAATKQP
jgi:Glycosyltransferase family 10 (fucosyltransferase) C-term